MKEQASKLFIHFLNRSYYIKSHLSERLDELSESVLFADLKEVITETISSLNLQLSESDELFEILDANGSTDDSESIFHLLERVFTMIQCPENTVPLLSFLDYISTADALLSETAKMAEIYRVQLPASYLSDYSLYEATLQPLRITLEESLLVHR